MGVILKGYTGNMVFTEESVRSLLYMFPNIVEQIKSEARTEFAEWLCEKLDMNVDKILEEYEREQKNG